MIAADLADDRAARMIESWERNAAAWTDAVRGRRIASRRAGTDAAIVAAVLRGPSASIIDIGCGEGWLARELAGHGCAVVGIDACAALIGAARALGGARFEAIGYGAIEARAREIGAPFDVAVCNFSLLDADIVPALRATGGLLPAHGRLVIQTVHPWIANGDGEYADGWREETFADFGPSFVASMPWYFRTLASWTEAIEASGFAIARCEEPADPASGKPLSLLLTAVPAAVC
jgi:2-polyprenyl-3-methyl-5-hydroxy-6-metoxy-1,4-benzoquinol methylase